jgi:hypothetical protein
MNLVALGCSLMFIYGMKEFLAEYTHKKLVNLSHSASSNKLQITRFQEYILHNSFYTNDIILWEITSCTRPHIRLINNDINLSKAKEIQTTYKLYGVKNHFVVSHENIFDKNTRLDLLCQSPMIPKSVFYEHDYNDSLQELLSVLILAKKYHNKLLVFFGWKDIMEQSTMIIFKNILDKNQIDYLDEFYLDWALENKMAMFDSTHPSAESSREFGKNIILPKLNQLGWLDTL